MGCSTCSGSSGRPRHLPDRAALDGPAWRLFVAAPLPAAAADEAFAALAPLRARHPEARWAGPEKLHLTLVFLGQTDAHRVVPIAAALAAVAAGHAAFEVETGPAGGRADGRRTGVAWLRLSDGAQQVSEVALELDRAIGSATYDERRAPRPHLTVARLVDQALLDDLHGLSAGLRLRWTVDRLVLLRSHTDPRGSRYESLAESELPGS